MCISGLYSLSKALGISIQSIRTSLNKLKSTNEITIKSTNKYSLITIVRYDDYQSINKILTNKSTGKLTSHQQTTNKQLTISNTVNTDNTDKENKYNIFLQEFNSLRGTKYQLTPEVKKLYDVQNKTFTSDQIIQAVRNIPFHQWLKTIEYSPTIFLRTNKDWIDQCLNLDKNNNQSIGIRNKLVIN